jgi:quercetin dioxygenase-like cupin family protein
MTEETRYLIDPYLDWIEAEGIPVSEHLYLDLFQVPTAPWPRFGVNGAAAHVTGRGDFASLFVFEIAPGKSTIPQRHLYEEVVYILEGAGSTQLEFADGQKRSFEWGQHSLFAIPLNAKFRHFNASGRDRALMVSTTNLPLVLNTFVEPRFVFENDFAFSNRIGTPESYAGEGEMAEVKKTFVWETNFVADIGNMDLPAVGSRGKGNRSLIFQLADGMMHAHVSEIQTGVYKKGHRHGPGYHVMIVKGTGFSLMWFDIDKDMARIEWKHGLVFPPADRQFHQHFNTSTTPARYLATRVGNRRYTFTAENRRNAGGGLEQAASTLSVKLGGDQIEYEDQDPRIHKIYVEEMRKHGLAPDPDMQKILGP